MMLGDNLRTINKLYECVKGNTKGRTKFFREKVLPFANFNQERYEVSKEKAYDIACESFAMYIKMQMLNNFEDIENYLLVNHNYSSTFTHAHMLKQEPPLICGAYRHGMNVARQSRWMRI